MSRIENPLLRVESLPTPQHLTIPPEPIAQPTQVDSSAPTPLIEAYQIFLHEFNTLHRNIVNELRPYNSTSPLILIVKLVSNTAMKFILDHLAPTSIKDSYSHTFSMNFNHYFSLNQRQSQLLILVKEFRRIIIEESNNPHN